MASKRSREIIRQRAASGDPTAKFVDFVLSRREAGTHRQMTTDEILTRVAERQAAGFVYHAGRVHSALNPCDQCPS